MSTVCLVQHGRALAKEVDASRPLSETGSEEVRRVAQCLRAAGLGIERICHSGKLRAAQTAQLFAEALQVAEVAEIEGMQPNDPAEAFIAGFDQVASLYVGHLPQLERVAALLLTGDAERSVLQFENAAVACLSVDAGVGRLCWMLTPGLCSAR